jgi:hypothetical protein
MTDEHETSTVAFRVTEWTEWLPLFPDQATEGAMKTAQGVSFMQALPNEKLSEITVSAMQFQVKKRVRSTGPTIADIEIVDEQPATKDERPKIEVPGAEAEPQEVDDSFDMTFQLYSFRAVLVNQVDSERDPILIQRPTVDTGSRIVTAAGIPPSPNRAQRRSR